MKKLFLLLVACFVGSFVNADAQTYVNGYYRKDGTYVSGHYRSERNSTNHDNYSTVGNYNPYTGSTGSVAKDYSSSANNYGSGKTIHTGSRGGQYYINSNGNKTYVPKRNTSTSNYGSSTSTYGTSYKTSSSLYNW